MPWPGKAARAVMVASLTAGAAAAQGVHPRFGLGAGLTAPVGDYHATAGGQGFSTAWHGLALLAFKLPALPVAFRVDVSYGSNSANSALKDSLTSRLGAPTDEKTKLAGASVNLTYQSSSAARVNPYAIGGVGVYHTTISVSTATRGGAVFRGALREHRGGIGFPPHHVPALHHRHSVRRAVAVRVRPAPAADTVGR